MPSTNIQQLKCTLIVIVLTLYTGRLLVKRTRAAQIQGLYTPAPPREPAIFPNQYFDLRKSIFKDTKGSGLDSCK